MPCVLESPSTEEPVTITEAKSYLRIVTNDDNEYIESLITTARTRAEQFTGRTFVTQKYGLWLDTFPCDNCLYIPFPPLQQITSISLYDIDSAAHVLDAQLYDCDIQSIPGRVFFRKNIMQFEFRLRTRNAIKIEFISGYGASQDVPQPIKQAILLSLADMYCNRGDEITNFCQRSFELLHPYKVIML